MKIAIIITTLISLTGCAHSDPWTARDTAGQLLVTGVIVADAVTTSRIQDRPDLEEGQPLTRAIIGRNPSDSDVAMYFGTLALSNFLISRALPEKWRPYWQAGTSIYHGHHVLNNCDKDLC